MCVAWSDVDLTFDPQTDLRWGDAGQGDPVSEENKNRESVGADRRGEQKSGGWVGGT